MTLLCCSILIAWSFIYRIKPLVHNYDKTGTQLYLMTSILKRALTLEHGAIKFLIALDLSSLNINDA